MSLNLITCLRNWGASLISSNKSVFSSQAMPNESADQITQNFTSSTQFVAPSDGYVCLVAEDSSNTWYRVSLINNIIHYLFNNNAGAYFGSGWFAVRKGATIEANVKPDVSASIKFISTIGGGANRLLSLAQSCIRGGVLWLTSSKLSKLVSSLSSLPKKVLSLSSRRLRVITLHKHFTELATIKTMLLRLTAIFAFRLIAKRRELAYREVICYLPRRLAMARVRLAQYSLLKKEILSEYGSPLTFNTICATLTKLAFVNPLAKEVCHA